MTTTTPTRLLRSRRDGRRARELPGGATPHSAAAPPRRQDRLRRLVRGADDDPNWARPALFALLTLAAVVYGWNLTNSGYANEFYAAAAKSASKDWKAWLFGSLDSSNAITVDKPPASLWVMGLSARIFGFSSFSLLLPQALMGVGTVGLTYGAVRRWSGHAAGLLAGLVVTTTPVAALMFRFDNPDAMLVLLMTAAAYCVVRAIVVSGRDEPTTTRRGRVRSASATALRWMVGAGLLIGFAFLTKMLQGLLVLPGLGLAYLVAARFSLGTRIKHLAAALVSVIVGAGWFVALVAAWPAGARPYIGGSTNNSEWELALGYNGLGRILGGDGNAGGGGGASAGGGGFGGTAGLFRMFNCQFAGEISWLLPASLVLLVAGLVARRRAPRTDLVRASLVLWGGWLVVTMLCLSFMKGTVHSYYAVALAPAVAACIAVGGREVFARRSSLLWRVVLGAAICVSGVWSFRVLTTSASGWMPWLKWICAIAAVLGAMTFVAAPAWGARARRVAVTGLVVGVLGGLGGTSAYTFATMASGHNGSMPTAGPAVAGARGGMGSMGSAPGGAQGAPGGSTGSAGSAGSGTTGSSGAAGQAPSGTKPSGTAPSGAAPSSGSSGSASGAASSGGSAASSGSSSEAGASGSTTDTQRSAGSAGAQGGSTSNAALVKLLDATNSQWSAAVIGDQSAAGYILSSDTAVMSIGGWSGSDDNVTLAQFEQCVKNGDITYFIAGGGMGGGPGGNSGSGAQITAWVKAHYKATTVGGVTVYDLTKATS
ncbi:ArnT family glycosyltransferase [Dermacoccus nishinomiyaensis]